MGKRFSHPWAIYDVFQAKDDPVFIGVVTDALWEKFCKLFGLDDLWADETLRENNVRVQSRDRIMPVIRDLISSFTRDELIEKLEGTGLPFAPISRPEDMFDDPHLLASGGLEQVEMLNKQTAMLPVLPIEMDGKRPGGSSKMPEIGAHSDAVLTSLGFDQSEINKLKADGAVA